MHLLRARAGVPLAAQVLANVYGDLCISLRLVQGLHQLVYPEHDCLRQTGFHVTGQPLLQALQFLDYQRDVLVLERQTGREQWEPPQLAGLYTRVANTSGTLLQWQ